MNLFCRLQLQRRDAAVVLAAHVSWKRKSKIDIARIEMSLIIMVVVNNHWLVGYIFANIQIIFMIESAAGDELVQR